MNQFQMDDQGAEGRSSSEDIALAEALHEVQIPEGLESRLLASMPVQHPASVSVVEGVGSGGTRRAWLSSAASLAGLALAGRYLYVHRRLGEAEVKGGITVALGPSGGWVLPWLDMEAAPDIPLPTQLRLPRGWQYVRTVWADKTPAYDVTPPGGADSVLFAISLPRGISGFPDVPRLPQGASGGWRLAMWQDGEVLFVLASKGTDREFESLFLNAGMPSLV